MNSMYMFWMTLFLMVYPAGPSTRDKTRCHSFCTNCRVRCKRSKDPKICKEGCLEMKRSCCQSCGAGPGPRNTCDCS